MIYTCELCGKQFSQDEMMRHTDSNGNVTKMCVYCTADYMKTIKCHDCGKLVDSPHDLVTVGDIKLCKACHIKSQASELNHFHESILKTQLELFYKKYPDIDKEDVPCAAGDYSRSLKLVRLLSDISQLMTSYKFYDRMELILKCKTQLSITCKDIGWGCVWADNADLFSICNEALNDTIFHYIAKNYKKE